MGILSRSADLVYTFRFLKLLVTSWEDTNAYKHGIIDENGKRTNKRIQTSEEKSSYNTFHRLVFNIKRLIEKVPGGKTKIASYAAALFLLKEKWNLKDESIQKILSELNINLEDMLSEETQWFMSRDGAINQGVYKISEEKVVNSTIEPLVNKYDKIRVDENCYPVGNILGILIYEVTHINTNQKIYVSSGELIK